MMWSKDYTARFSAVIVAAGLSSRMHSFKPLLPLGDKTVLETTIQTFLQAGLKDIVVVVGHQSELLIPLIEAKGLKWVDNPHYVKGMFTSVQTGVGEIQASSEAVFVMPVDIPMVKPETIKLLIAAFDDQSGNVLYPSFEGRRGHPPLLSTKLMTELLHSADEGGLKGFLEKQGSPSYLVVNDPGILMDLDTEASYLDLVHSLKSI